MNVFNPATFLVPPRHSHGVSRSATGTSRFVDVRWSRAPPRPAARVRGAKLEGLKYERKVHDVLGAIYGPKFAPSPSIRYTVRGKYFAAIPDGILRVEDQIFVIEVKLSHTIDVWDQLMDRYAPLVAILEPELQVRTVEICRYYDPALDIPHTLITSLHRPGTGLEVLQWRI